MQISVVIPTFNRADVLVRALDSVFAQTEPAFEVIIVDDGSTDRTRTLVEQRFADCRYFFQENAGVSAARNVGVREAQGDWIAFLDSDDAWLPGKLAAQRDCLAQVPSLRFCHTEEIWIRHGRRVNAMDKHAKKGGLIYQRCLPLCVISPSSALIERSLLEELGGFDESMPACEDYDLWLRLCAQEPVAFVEQPQIEKYGGHDDQLSRRHWGMDRFRIYALEKMLGYPMLSVPDREATLNMLVEKCRIFALGAEKRGNHERAAQYRAKQQEHQQELNQLVVVA